MKPGSEPFPEALDLLHHELPAGPVLVGFSGGRDSTVLLHWLASGRLAPDRRLRALHVNHGLLPAAEGWAWRCREQAGLWGVDCRIVSVRARPAPGESPEAAARRARYDAFREVMTCGAVLITAHHQRDQAETVLLRLLRGASVHGLAAMPWRRDLGNGFLLRPLLPISARRIAAYARQHKLTWIEDPGNRDPRVPRSYLRHQVLPALEAFWPAAEAQLARAAPVCREAAGLLDEVAATDLAVLRGPGGGLSVPGLLALSRARRGNVLRHWILTQGLPPASRAHLEELAGSFLASAVDAMPLLRWPGAEVRRFRGHVYAWPPLVDLERYRGFAAGLSFGAQLQLPDGGRVVLRPGGRLDGKALLRGPLRVCFRHGGEHLRPTPGARRRSLKNLFQEAGVPPWERDRTPLLYGRAGLLAVGERWVAAEVTVPAARGWRFTWQRPGPSDRLRPESAGSGDPPWLTARCRGNHPSSGMCT